MAIEIGDLPIKNGDFQELCQITEGCILVTYMHIYIYFSTYMMLRFNMYVLWCYFVSILYANYLGNKSASKYRDWAHGIRHAMIFLGSTRYVPPMTNMLVCPCKLRNP